MFSTHVLRVLIYTTHGRLSSPLLCNGLDEAEAVPSNNGHWPRDYSLRLREEELRMRGRSKDCFRTARWQMLIAAVFIACCNPALVFGMGRLSTGLQLATLQSPWAVSSQAGGQSPQAAEVQGSNSAGLQAVLKKIKTSKYSSLAKAFGLPASSESAETGIGATGAIENIGDLDGDGVDEAVLKWQPPATSAQTAGNSEDAASRPAFYLLSWNSHEWLASKLVATDQPVLIQSLPVESDGPRALAAIVVEGSEQISYPLVFKFERHRAVKVWDGQKDQTYYQGLPFSHVSFREAGGAVYPNLIVSGQADPGVLIFPRIEGGNRGFQAETVYVWKNSAYIPVKTEYSKDPDYTLYRFIAALHRHDFKSAYALVEPRAFIKNGKPSLDRFRKQIEKNWPEFLDDHVFDAVSSTGEPLAGHSFELRNEDKVKATFHPQFGPGPAFLITGLKRSTPSH